MSSKEELKQVRAKFRRVMTPVDNSGFIFKSAFGCEKNEVFLAPHVLVRVELQATEGGCDLYRFMVFVDFHLPLGVDVERAEYFRRVAQSAVRRAKWAGGLVDGLEWSREELSDG